MSKHDTGPAHCPQCDYTPSDQPCDECGVGPGERCMPYCTVPFGPGGPYEHHDPADHDDAHTATPTPTQPRPEGPTMRPMLDPKLRLPYTATVVSKIIAEYPDGRHTIIEHVEGSEMRAVDIAWIRTLNATTDPTDGAQLTVHGGTLRQYTGRNLDSISARLDEIERGLTTDGATITLRSRHS